jgi:TAP-like protein
MVTLEARTHGVYGLYGNACVDRQVESYLLSGRLPAVDVTCAGAAGTASQSVNRPAAVPPGTWTAAGRFPG